MNPVVIDLFTKDGESHVMLGEAPRDFARGVEPSLLRASASGQPYLSLNAAKPPPGIVAKCGKHLSRSIMRHGGIRQVLEYVDSGTINEEFPIYFRIRSPDSENLPWEAIWSKRWEFLALRPTTQVARTPGLVIGADPTRIVEPRLKVVAVLAAANVDAAGEWSRLRDLVREMDGRVALHVITSQDDIYEAVSLAGEAQITAQFVPSTPEKLLLAIQEARPNLLHFFCHGDSEGATKLLVAKRSLANVALNTKHMAQLAGIDSLLLLVLNCCRGAESAGVYSTARDLIDVGIPAVVAMRSSIPSTDAVLFTAAFYGALLRPLVMLLPSEHQTSSGSTLSEGVLLRALATARRELSEAERGNSEGKRCPSDSWEWTLPVLYLRRPGVRLKLRKNPALIKQLAAQIGVLSQGQAKLPPDTPAAVLAAVQAQIAQLEASLVAASEA